MVEGKSSGGSKGGKGTSPSASKSYLARVLLHDNVSQQQLLNMRLSQITVQQKRVTRMWDNHKKTFVYKQFQKQQQFRDVAVDPSLVRLLPAAVQKEYCLMVSETDSTPPLSPRTGEFEHGLSLPPIEQPSVKSRDSPQLHKSEQADPIDAVIVPDEGQNQVHDSLLSLDEKPPPKKSAHSGSADSRLEALPTAKKALDLPPLTDQKNIDNPKENRVVNDKRFADLFESLTGNFFTDAYGRHPLIS